MKTALTILLLASAAAAQQPAPPILTLTGPAFVRPGDSTTLNLSVSATTTTKLAAIQWTLAVPPGTSLGPPSAPAAGPNAGKGLGVFCTGTETLCMVVGWNGTAAVVYSLADGLVASVPLVVSKQTAVGTYPLNLSGILGATADSFNQATVAGQLYSLKVVAPCDLDGSGAVTVADVQLVINQALGITACSLGTACPATVVQVQQVIVAALGGACNM